MFSPCRRNRDTIAEREKELDPEIVEAKRAAEIEKQKEQSKNLVADSIVRELAGSEFSLFFFYTRPVFRLADVSIYSREQRKLKLFNLMSTIPMDWIPKENLRNGNYVN
jgi:hypothetical protein